MTVYNSSLDTTAPAPDAAGYSIWGDPVHGGSGVKFTETRRWSDWQNDSNESYNELQCWGDESTLSAHEQADNMAAAAIEENVGVGKQNTEDQSDTRNPASNRQSPVCTLASRHALLAYRVIVRVCAATVHVIFHLSTCRL